MLDIMNICKKYYKGGLFTKRINQITCDEYLRHVRLIADLEKQNEELQRKLETLIWEKKFESFAPDFAHKNSEIRTPLGPNKAILNFSINPPMHQTR